MSTSKRLEWFCGSNATSADLYTFIDSPELLLKNICLINFCYAIFHITSAIVLLFAWGTTCWQTKNQAYLLVKLPGHNIRWLFSIVLLLTQIDALAEGVLSDRTQDVVSTLLYLYIPSLCAFVSAAFAVLSSHSVELWRRKWPFTALLVYWTLSCAFEIIRLGNMVHLGMGHYQVVRFDVEVLLAVIYGILGLIQAYSIGSSVMSNDTALTIDSDDGMMFLRESISLPSRILLQWMHRLMSLGYEKALTISDLRCLPEEHLVASNHYRFNQSMKDELRSASISGRKPSLLRILWKHSWKVWIASAILRVIGDPLGLIIPFAIGGIITNMEDIDVHSWIWSMGLNLTVDLNQTVAEFPQKETFHFISLQDFFSNGFVLLLVIFVANVIDRLCFWTSNYLLTIQSLHIKVAIQAAVYKKSLQLSSLLNHRGQDVTHEITNYMSDDAVHIMLAVQRIHFILPLLMTLAVLVLLYNTLGFAALCGFVVPVVLFPVFSIFGKSYFSVYQRRALIHAEGRIKHTYNLLKDIKLLKLNAWEELFCEAIENLRLKEVYELSRRNLVYAVSAFGIGSTPLLMMLVSFGTYTHLAGKPLTPEVAFISLALFNLLDRFLLDIPVTLSSVMYGYMSAKKLKDFVLTTHVDTGLDSDAKGLDAGGDFELNGDSKPDYGETMVQFSYCNTAWNETYTNTEPVLKNIDVNIQTGELTVVVGPVGSGKSAFLASILGEMTLISGNINFPSGKPTMALASQRPWIENASLQDNILCGLSMSRQRYRAVISACALEADIALLPAGDATEIGERGINLSIGQKQRVNIARAIYSQARLIILDDPLSALDVNVGTHVFENGIMGLLRRNNRTVVLVTNQLQYVKHADKVIILDEGAIYHQGSQENIINIVNSDQDLLSQWDQQDRQSSANESEDERVALQKQVTQQQQYGDEDNAKAAKSAKSNLGETSMLMQKDETERNSVASSVYLVVLCASFWSLSSSIIGFGGVQAFLLVKDLWLAVWSTHGENDLDMTDAKTAYFIEGYTGFSVAGIVVIVCSNLLLTLAAYKTGITLHTRMLNNVIMLPFRFFDTNPLDSVLNRFSSDIEVIDTTLFRYLNGSIQCIWTIMFCFIAIIIVVPYFAIVAVIIGIVYLLLQRYYLKTARELQRLENASKSPVLTHFSETLDGLSTIKAYRFQKRLFTTLMERIDTHSTTYMYLTSAKIWMNIRLDLMGACVVLLAGLSSISYGLVSNLNPAFVALAIVYAQKVSTLFADLVSFVSSLETQMNSVDRVKTYTTLPTERYEGYTTPPKDWPMRGAIRFEDVTVKYTDDSEPVLRWVNLNINAGEKIGICGRSGSGKSSLATSLLRYNVISKGRIYIDKINICDVPLTTLRQRLAIIPHDPTLLTGSIRNNLDPEGNISDEELWDALAVARVKSVVSLLTGGLDAEVSESGGNFSAGQRQLFCLARAFLRKSRILIMDETSAKVENKTAVNIQEVLKHAFANRTVLTVSSDVNSILESDRVVVMSEGKVAEVDDPKNLFADQSSMFSSFMTE